MGGPIKVVRDNHFLEDSLGRSRRKKIAVGELLVIVFLTLLSLVTIFPLREVAFAFPENVLQFDNYLQVYSTTQAQTSSSTLVDDPQAILNFTLTENRVVLVLYSACNYKSSIEDTFGKELAIAVDNTTQAKIHTGAIISGQGNGGTVVWLGTLEAGAHTIKGRFRTMGSFTVTIDERRLTAVIFIGDAADFIYTRSTVQSSTNSDTFVDDPQANVTIDTPACKALIIYSTTTYAGVVGANDSGMWITTNVNGTDYPVDICGGDLNLCASDSADQQHATIVTFAEGSNTVKGRFRRSYNAGNAYISERQLAILLLPSNLETDIVNSTGTVSVTGTTLSDDNEASIIRTITASRYALAFYTVSRSIAGASAGKKVAVKIDGTDYTLNAQKGGADASVPNGVSFHSGIVELAPGSHTVKGRFAANDAAQTAKVNRRILSVLWFSPADPIPPGKPVLVSPENATSTADNTPTFTWTRGSNADNHRIEVDNDDNRANGVVDNQVIASPNDNTWTKPSPGYANGTYYWRVWAQNDNMENVSENTWQFTIQLPPLGKPVLVSPENGTITSDNTPTFTWTKGSNADNHRIEIDNDSNFSSPIDNVVIASPNDNTWTKLSPGYNLGTYYWRVWAKNSQGENCSENTWQFTIAPPPPSKPVLVSPENGISITDNTPTFTWTKGSNADNHRIEIDNDSNFSSPIDNVVIASPNDNTWTKPSPGYALGTYYWRVWARNAAGENVSENTWKFTVFPQYPGKPVLVSLENNTSTSDNTPTFTWTKGSNADNHRIEVDNDSNFSSPIDNVVVASPNDNTWTKSSPGYVDGTYYWRVWAINAQGENCSENTWKFSIVPPAPVYPNFAPSCSITSPSDGSEFTVGMEIQFVCSASDPDGDPLVYAWDFGDGGTSPDLIPKHTYTAAGDYTVILTVSDGYGGMASDQITVHIHPWTPPPPEDEPSENEPPENGPPPPYTPQTPPSGLPELVFAASVALLVVVSLLLIRRMR